MIFVGPTAAHSHPLAQLIGLLSGHTFHGMENKHRMEQDMDRSTGDKWASCQAKVYSLIHPWFSTDLSGLS